MNRSVVSRVLPYFRPHLARFSVALVAMAAVAALTAAAMWILKQVIDKALTAGDVAALKDIVIVVVLLYFMKAALSYVHDYMTYYIGQAIVRQLRDNVYSHLHSLSMDFFTLNDSARLVARLTNDAQLVQNALTKMPIMIVRDGLTILFLTGFLLYLHWKFALMAFVLLPVAGALIARFGKSLRKTSRLGQAKMSDLYLRIQETVTAAPVVKAFQREEHERARFRDENAEFFRISMKNARVESLSSPVMEFLGAAGMAVILWLGGLDVIHGVWSTGAFLAFIGSALSMYQPVKNFSRSNATLQQALAGAERMFEILDTRPGVLEAPDAAGAPPFASAVRFEDVSFRYRADRPVLDRVDLEIKKGEVVALVGPSGSGKTTLAALLLRFYDPTAGRVTLDGRDLRSLRLDALRAQIGLVTQETLLFNDTVRRNIGYAKKDATEAEIAAAARAANAWEFIEKLPQGLDTLVGERGVLLSGGQKQRLAIARAILKNPPILILDEATSALDAESEKLVQLAVEELMRNRTVVVIAHRLATVKRADRIVVLERGRVAEAGSHETLLSQGGLYQRLYQLQILEA
jgi:ATP-binding cassette, subfamily B, bacterial MsbA